MLSPAPTSNDHVSARLPAFDGLISFAGEYRPLNRSKLCKGQSIFPAWLTLGIEPTRTVEGALSWAVAGISSHANTAARGRPVAAGFNLLIDCAPFVSAAHCEHPARYLTERRLFPQRARPRGCLPSRSSPRGRRTHRGVS